jgi:hypothetical protein
MVQAELLGPQQLVALQLAHFSVHNKMNLQQQDHKEHIRGRL